MPTAPPTSASTRLSVRSCRAIDPRRAERRPHRHLALPRGAAREEQIGDVGAGDEQQEAHRGEQQPQRVLRGRAQEIVAERLDAGSPAAVGVGKLRRLPLGDQFQRALACSTVTPGFSRPSAMRKRAPRSAATASGRPAGSEAVLDVVGGPWPSTPITSYGSRRCGCLSEDLRSPPKRSSQGL